MGRGKIAGRARTLSGGLVLVAAFAFTREARAESAETARVRKELHTYYEGEKSGSLQFALPGLVSLGVGTALLATDPSDMAKGAAVPVLAFGAIELGAGLVLFLRSDALVARLDGELTRGPTGWKAAETDHLRRVRDQFAALMWTEIAVAGIGAGMAAGGAYAKAPTVQGIGIGLAVESSVLFILDSIAAERAKPYLSSLESFRVGRAGDSGWGVSYGARF
jgi:hypothetical protein